MISHMHIIIPSYFILRKWYRKGNGGKIAICCGRDLREVRLEQEMIQDPVSIKATDLILLACHDIIL